MLVGITAPPAPIACGAVGVFEAIHTAVVLEPTPTIGTVIVPEARHAGALGGAAAHAPVSPRAVSIGEAGDTRPSGDVTSGARRARPLAVSVSDARHAPALIHVTAAVGAIIVGEAVEALHVPAAAAVGAVVIVRTAHTPALGVALRVSRTVVVDATVHAGLVETDARAVVVVPAGDTSTIRCAPARATAHGCAIVVFETGDARASGRVTAASGAVHRRAVLIGGAGHAGAGVEVTGTAPTVLGAAATHTLTTIADIASRAVAVHDTGHAEVARRITDLAVGALSPAAALHTDVLLRLADAFLTLVVADTLHTGRGHRVAHALGAVGVFVALNAEGPSRIAGEALRAVCVSDALSAATADRITGRWCHAVLISSTLTTKARVGLTSRRRRAAIVGGITRWHAAGHQRIAHLTLGAGDVVTWVHRCASIIRRPALLADRITREACVTGCAGITPRATEPALGELDAAVCAVTTVAIGLTRCAGWGAKGQAVTCRGVAVGAVSAGRAGLTAHRQRGAHTIEATLPGNAVPLGGTGASWKLTPTRGQADTTLTVTVAFTGAAAGICRATGGPGVGP